MILRHCADGGKMCVAVKANAYGHGIRQVLPALHEANIDMLAVAAIDEAIELRDLNWRKPILVLGSEFSIYGKSQKNELAELIVKNELRITATQKEDIDTLARAAEKLHTKAAIHLMFDSGLSRMGLRETELLDLMQYISTKGLILIEGLYTHFATADSFEKTFANQQIDAFKKILNKIEHKIPIIHASNSSATIDLPHARFDMVRPGISIYGYNSSFEMRNKPPLKPVMKLTSHLTFIKKIPKGSFVGYSCTFRTPRETTIGVVPIGYADGYPRRLSNRGKMLIDGRPAPVIGRVSMDQTILDLTDLLATKTEIHPGSEVTIIDDNRESPNSVESIAKLIETIPHTIITGIGKRVRRTSVS